MNPFEPLNESDRVILDFIFNANDHDLALFWRTASDDSLIELQHILNRVEHVINEAIINEMTEFPEVENILAKFKKS
jgi:hypothetical protein